MSIPYFNQPVDAAPGPSELEYDLHHVAQHNVLQDEQQGYEEAPAISTTLPSYQEPEPIGLGLNFENYSTYVEAQPYDTYRQEGYNSYSDVDFQTPPTTDESPNPPSTVGRSTRSGRALARVDSPMSSDARVSKPKPKAKTKKPKKTLPPEYQLKVPFTRLDVDWGDIPLKAVNKRAKWSKEERKAQATKKDGHIARPMNCFMLYRAAWADRCKHYFKISNHQLVSAIGAHSWKLETQDVKDHWIKLSKDESENHKAHLPEYRYQPTKPAGKKDQDDSDFEDFGLDDDPDGEYMPSTHIRRQTRRQPPRSIPESSISRYEQELYGDSTQVNVSGWQYDHIQQPQRITYDQPQPYPIQSGQYLQAGINYQWQAPVDEARAMNATPASAYSLGHGLVGLPSGQSHELQQNARTQTPMQHYSQPSASGDNFTVQDGAVFPDGNYQHHFDQSFGINFGQDTQLSNTVVGMNAPASAETLLQDGNWLDPDLDGNIHSEYSFALNN